MPVSTYNKGATDHAEISIQGNNWVLFVHVDLPFSSTYIFPRSPTCLNKIVKTLYNLKYNYYRLWRTNIVVCFDFLYEMYFLYDNIALV